MEPKKTSLLYKIIKALVRLFSPKMTVEGLSNLPGEPCVIVGNHTQMYGPISCELYLPRPSYTWCAAEMMTLREVPAYAWSDFWSQKPAAVRWFYRLLSYIIAPLSVCVFTNADTVPVYHDARIITTFRETMRLLGEGANVVIFPEHDVKHNRIVYDFQDKFIDVARFYYRRTGRVISFVPMYIAPRLKKMCLGAPVRFDPDAPIAAERRRICEALMDDITALAEALPRHTVVPYRNIPKRDYPQNIPDAR